MKAEIHPEYKETTIQCTCGAVYQTRSTVNDLRVGICGACHPFFTGEQRFVDTAGRVEKFAQRYGSAQERRREKPRREVEPQKPKKKKEEEVEVVEEEKSGVVLGTAASADAAPSEEAAAAPATDAAPPAADAATEPAADAAGEEKADS